MKKVFRWLLIVFLILVVLFYGLLWFVDFYMHSSSDGESIDGVYSGYHENYTRETLVVGDSELRFIGIGDEEKTTLLFVYGTPGSMMNWESVIGLVDFDKYRVIVIDRPGFGESTNGILETSLSDQVVFLGGLIDDGTFGEDVVLVGWSYAGAYLAGLLDKTNVITGALMIAGTMDPNTQKIWGASYVMTHRLVEWSIPSFLTTTNYEKLASVDDLKKQESLWGYVEQPVVLMHGVDDRIVDPENSRWVAEQMDEDLVFLLEYEGLGHGMPMSNPELVIEGLDILFDMRIE